MAYNTAQLMLLTDRLVADGMNHWTYDTADALATVIAAGYISDAYKAIDNPGGRGLQVGDRITIRRFSDVSTKATILSVTDHFVTAVSLAATTLSEAVNVRGVVEDGAAVVLTAGQSGSLCVFDKTDGALFTLPAPSPGLYFDFVVDAAASSGSHKVITSGASIFIKGTVLQMTAADAANVLDTANGSTHVSVTMNGTTTGGVVGTRFRLTSRSATVWEIEGLTLASGSVATSFAAS